MNLGKFDLNESPVGRSSRLEGPQVGGGSSMDDLPRLLLLLGMMLAAIGGWMYDSWRDDPVRVVRSTAEHAAGRSFNASVEGGVSLRNAIQSTFRNRQHIDPGEPVAFETGTVGSGENQSPFDARTALETLTTVVEALEHAPEDMYVHGTRRFSGTLAISDAGPAVVDSFEYWIDLRTREPVRLVLTREEQNAGFDADGALVSRITTMNIRFHLWR